MYMAALPEISPSLLVKVVLPLISTNAPVIYVHVCTREYQLKSYGR